MSWYEPFREISSMKLRCLSIMSDHLGYGNVVEALGSMEDPEEWLIRLKKQLKVASKEMDTAKGEYVAMWHVLDRKKKAQLWISPSEKTGLQKLLDIAPRLLKQLILLNMLMREAKWDIEVAKSDIEVDQDIDDGRRQFREWMASEEFKLSERREIERMVGHGRAVMEEQHEASLVEVAKMEEREERIRVQQEKKEQRLEQEKLRKLRLKQDSLGYGKVILALVDSVRSSDPAVERVIVLKEEMKEVRGEFKSALKEIALLEELLEQKREVFNDRALEKTSWDNNFVHHRLQELCDSVGPLADKISCLDRNIHFAVTKIILREEEEEGRLEKEKKEQQMLQQKMLKIQAQEAQEQKKQQKEKMVREQKKEEWEQRLQQKKQEALDQKIQQKKEQEKELRLHQEKRLALRPNGGTGMSNRGGSSHGLGFGGSSHGRRWSSGQNARRDQPLTLSPKELQLQEEKEKKEKKEKKEELQYMELMEWWRKLPSRSTSPIGGQPQAVLSNMSRGTTTRHDWNYSKHECFQQFKTWVELNPLYETWVNENKTWMYRHVNE
jgi:hypothetical protein